MQEARCSTCRGRTILPVDESVAGQNAVAVIGYDYWRSRFALDPNIIGKTILLNNAPFTIVGVTEPEFYGVQPGEKVDISVPITTVTLVNPAFATTGSPYDTLKAPFRNWLYVMGRLQPGMPWPCMSWIFSSRVISFRTRSARWSKESWVFIQGL